MLSRTVRALIPPDAEHVPLLGTTVAGVAARERFTLDEVEDLRLGVEEAAVQLLRQEDAEALSLAVTLDEGGLSLTLSMPRADAAPVMDRDSFSWTILSTLLDDVVVDHDGGAARIVLVKHRTQVKGA